MVRQLVREQIVQSSLEETFAFFASANNLELITPPWLHFRIVTRAPIEMRGGTEIEYRLRLRGLPVRWRSRIEDWSPPHSFTDVQIAGPYPLWRHKHSFQSLPGVGTLVRDRVDYEVPGGRLLAGLIDRLYVRRELRLIFDYRHSALERALAPQPHAG